MRGMKKLAAVVIALVAVIAVAGTSIPVEAAAKAPKKITLKTTSKTVDIKGKATVSVKSVSPKGASKAVKYTSSNKKVATVSSKGVVTGKKAGKVTITATSKKSKKVKKTIKITVKQLKPTQISLSSKAAMKTGDKKALKATVKPAGVYCPLSWSSGNKSVATVDKKGNVTAKAPGTAVITVKSKEKNKKGKYLTKKCTVTVTAKEIKVSALTFADKEKTLTGLGTTYTNKLTIAPANATNKKVTYSSSDPKIAAVDSASGKVTTVAAGSAAITASAADGSGKKASYKLTVADRMNANIDWQYVESADLIANKEDYVIIDLRPTKALNSSIGDNGYEQGHIEGSVWVPAWPVNSADKENLLRASYVLEQLKDNDKKIAFICQSGAGGAKRAISVMADAGIDLSRMYIQKGGGKDLLANHKEQLVTEGEFSGDYVISAADLKTKIDAKETMILVDTRGIGAAAETAQNAITINWKDISLSDKQTGNNKRAAGDEGFARSLPAADMGQKLGALGLGLNDQIILFSDGHVSGGWGDDGRIAWQLFQCGYTNVKMVNGGLAAMKTAGIPVQKGPSKAAAKAVTVAGLNTDHDITTKDLLDHFADYKIIDVRANAEFDGEVLYGEKSGGHIKGALHIRFTDLFRYNGTLKSADELKAMFKAAGLNETDKVVTYCTGGIRSAYMQLVLQMVGYQNTYNYAESAYRWSNTASAGTAAYWSKETAVTGISFEKDELVIGAKEAAGSVKLRIMPSYATNKAVEYKSSDEKIATVDQNGKVTAVEYGEATITAATKDGSNLTASYTVKVQAPEAVTERQVYVSPEWVKSAMDGKQAGYDNAFISEVSWGALKDAAAYNEGHVKGAFHINSDEVEYDDCDPWPNGDGQDDFGLYDEKDVAPEDNFNIRSPEQLRVFLKRKGITQDTKVILYGKSASDSSITRVAFAMLYAGVKDVKVIDGGMEGWKKAGLPTETKVNEPTAGGESYDFGAKKFPAHPEYIMSIDTVKDKLENDPNFRLVSIRSEDEFIGKKTGYAYIKDENAGEPLGAVWGHDTDNGYYVQNGKVASIDKVGEILAESGSSLDNELSFYCGTGWRATIPFLICYQAGYKNISLYDGGWWLWQLKWEKNPEDWPIQKVTPEEAVGHAVFKFAEKEITKDADGNRLTSAGATAAKNEMKAVPARVNATPAITGYTSSDEKVATVAADGTVTTTGYGTATITATLKSGDTVSYKVTVSDRKDDEISWQEKSSADVIKEAAEGTLIVLDTRPDSIPRTNDAEIPDAGYAAGHIQGAIHVDSWPVDEKAAEDALRNKAASLKRRNKPVAIICQSGAGGAKRAISVLIDAGIDPSMLFIQTGGGLDLLKNHKSELVTGSDGPVNTEWTAADFTYSDDGTAITGLSLDGADKLELNTDVVMPTESSEGIAITRIADAAMEAGGIFGKDAKVKSVVLPAQLEAIGNNAFFQCDLEKIAFPDTLKTIGNSVFNGNNLTEIILPDSVKTVGNGAFTNNYQIEKVVISKGMTVIPGGFVGCPGNIPAAKLTQIEIPEGITEIGDNAFAGNSFASIEIPGSVTKIGRSAFYQADTNRTVEEVILHEGLEQIGRYAFQFILAPEIRIPSTVTTIDPNAFRGCAIKVYTYNESFTTDYFKSGVTESVILQKEE